MITHDVLIVGGGLAGLRAAVAASRQRDVAVVSQVHPLRSNSVTVEEGINAALGNHPASGADSPRLHLTHTVAAGEYLNEPHTAGILCEEAARAVFDLDRWGAPFDRMAGGLIAQRGAASGAYPRTCFAGRRVGHALLNTLFEQVIRWRIRVYEEHRVLALAVKDGQCFGAVALVPATGELVPMAAKSVVLATGGCGRLYEQSTNALHCTGSGMALAGRAGVPLTDMEFVHFHPLAVADGQVVLPMALLSAGATLLNAVGDRFLEDLSEGEAGSLQPDVVARAIAAEIAEGRGGEGHGVRLDVSRLQARRLPVRLDELRREVARVGGMDPSGKAIAVAPAEQFAIGGVTTDEHGATAVQGLFAAGECAWTGAHGARALRGNTVLEAVVFGRRAGERAGHVAGKRSPVGVEEALQRCCRRTEESLKTLLSNGSGESPAVLRARLREVMQSHVAVRRSGSGLSRALQELRDCRRQYEAVEVSGATARFNSDLMAAIELGEMLDAAEAIAAGAARRTESRGTHFRADSPDRDDDKWLRHSAVSLSGDRPAVSHRPVTSRQGVPAGVA